MSSIETKRATVVAVLRKINQAYSRYESAMRIGTVHQQASTYATYEHHCQELAELLYPGETKESA